MPFLGLAFLCGFNQSEQIEHNFYLSWKLHNFFYLTTETFETKV